jgi:hypothetical protein
MVFSRTPRRNVFRIAALLAALLVISGCAGIQPYEPRDDREEGPEKGLFTGSEGEFVIFRKADEPKKDSEDKKSPTESESVAQPRVGGDQSGNVDKAAGDAP